MRLMRHMRWSYADLMVCPFDYVQVISDEAEREQAALKERMRR